MVFLNLSNNQTNKQCFSPTTTTQRKHIYILLDSDLFEVVGGVDAGLDLPLDVEAQQGLHGVPDEGEVLQVAQVEATHRLVGLHQLQGADGQLVVPRLGYGQQVLLLPGHTVGCT